MFKVGDIVTHTNNEEKYLIKAVNYNDRQWPTYDVENIKSKSLFRNQYMNGYVLYNVTPEKIGETYSGLVKGEEVASWHTAPKSCTNYTGEEVLPCLVAGEKVLPYLVATKRVIKWLWYFASIGSAAFAVKCLL